MQKVLADLPVKKLEIGHWPGAVARRWIWSILFLFTFALLGYGELTPDGGYSTAAVLLGFILLAWGCLYFAGYSDRNYIYSLELVNGNIMRSSTIWRTRDVLLRDIYFFKLYRQDHMPGPAGEKSASRYARIIYRGGSLRTYFLTDVECSNLQQLFSAIVASEPHIELEIINFDYALPSQYGDA